jgi:3-hydroxyisobutyrate dehydrogenase
MKLGIIGCGNMGGGMVARLRERGQDLQCFDPDPVILARMQGLGASTTSSASELAQGCDTILLSLPKAAVVRAVMAEILPHLAQGSLILDTSTSEPATSQAMAAEAARRGAFFIDGPVSGGPSAARAGTMTMLLGGDPEAISRLAPLLAHLTTKTVIVGGSGAGHAAKIANNMLCAANLVLVAEALRLGAAAGVAPEALLEGINAGSGRSGVSEVNFPRWILNGALNSGFTMGLMRKDVGLALSLAAANHLDLPAFAPIAALWAASAETLPDSADFNAIAKVTP